MAALLAGAIILLIMASISATRTGLRATQQTTGDTSRGVAREIRDKEPAADFRRSLLQTRNPECTMPLEDPCTLNTTAIGMVEAGYATYYDE